jgi:lipoprotein-releasing system ATP-binding protein
MSEWVLEALDLHKTFRTGSDEVAVLRGLNLQIHPGEFLAVVGASGSGKSTLMYLLGGLDRPGSGSIRVALDGPDKEPVEIHRMSDSALNQYRGRHIGFVFQFHHLLQEFSALENVLLPALVQGEPLEGARHRATILLEQMGLGERCEHRPTQLSGGEAQRVAIARALINRPRLLLMDEPTGNLDKARGEKIFDQVEHIHRQFAQTIVVVTHDPEVAARAGRRLRLAGGVLEEIAG